jgi:hypothetical protein
MLLAGETNASKWAGPGRMSAVTRAEMVEAHVGEGEGGEMMAT